MKRSLVWTAVGAGVIGIGVPAYAATQTGSPQPAVTTVGDISGNCDEAEHANDPACVTAPPVSAGASTTSTIDESTTTSIDDSTSSSVDTNLTTANSIDDEATETSVDVTGTSVDDDATENSVEDVRGNCDEAEHADDPACTDAPGAAEDNSGPGNSDDSGHDGGSDDSGHHGHGGNDD